MPYVTDEIYSMIPGITENIMVSDYPKYNKKDIYPLEENQINDTIEFIRIYRKTYQENHMDKSVIVKFNNDENYSLISKMLKINNTTKESIEKTNYNVNYKNYDVTIYFETVLTEEEKASKERELEALRASIKKREALLSNENFVSKAPANLVENEKQKLAEEKEKLAKLEN